MKILSNILALSLMASIMPAPVSAMEKEGPGVERPREPRELPCWRTGECDPPPCRFTDDCEPKSPRCRPAWDCKPREPREPHEPRDNECYLDARDKYVCTKTPKDDTWDCTGRCDPGPNWKDYKWKDEKRPSRPSRDIPNREY